MKHKYKVGDLFSFKTRYHAGYLFMIVGIRTRLKASGLRVTHAYRMYYFDYADADDNQRWYDGEIFERAIENGRYSIVYS